MTSADQPANPRGRSKPPGRPELNRLKSQTQGEFDLEFFGAILARAPENIDALRCQAELLSAAGRHAQALELDRRLAAIRPLDCLVQYNLACSLAVQSQPEAALATLERALALGYDDLDYLEQDADLSSLHDLPAYRRLIAHYREAADGRSD